MLIPLSVAVVAFGLGLILFSGQPKDQPETGPSASAQEAPFRPASNSYEARLPTGNGWSRNDEALIRGAIYRTAAHGPSGLELVIDHTPNEPATFSLEDQSDCQTFSHPAFPLAKRCRFQGGRFPQCQPTRCINYLLNVSSAGPGFAVLGAGPDEATASAMGERVARSLRPR